MMIKAGITGMMLMLAVAVAAAAKPLSWRIDLCGSGRDKPGLVFNGGSDGVTGTKAEWLKADMDKRLVVTAPADSAWKSCSFTFTPKKSGTVELLLMSESSGWVAIDAVNVSGAEAASGNMEQIDARGNPAGWTRMNSPRLVTDGKAADGRNYVEVNHNNRFILSFKVVQGQAVTVRVSARAAAAAPVR